MNNMWYIVGVGIVVFALSLLFVCRLYYVSYLRGYEKGRKQGHNDALGD
jgi:hypothetical protein